MRVEKREVTVKRQKSYDIEHEFPKRAGTFSSQNQTVGEFWLITKHRVNASKYQAHCMKSGLDLGQSDIWTPLQLPDSLLRQLNEGVVLPSAVAFLLSSLGPSLKHRRKGRGNGLLRSFFSRPCVLDGKPGPCLRRLRWLTVRLSCKKVLRHRGNIQNSFTEAKLSKHTVSWTVTVQQTIYRILLAEVGLRRASWGRKVNQGTRKSRSEVLICSLEKHRGRANKGRQGSEERDESFSSTFG